MAKIIADRRVSTKSVYSNLDRIKANIADSHQYFKENYKRFSKFRKMIFDTSLTDEEVALNLTLGKPTLEFNILEAYISRLRGEFSKQEPSLEITTMSDAHGVDARLVNFLENHIRARLFEANRDNMAFDVYTDILSGGYSAIKFFTEYLHEMSFDQDVMLRRVFDPTMCGWDKLARESHKGDGAFCFEMYVREKSDFESEYGDEYTQTMDFTRNLGGFNWSYANDSGKMILMCDYYEKKKTKGKIVQLVDGRTLKEQDYEKEKADHDLRMDSLIQFPAVIGKPRYTEFVQICRYVLIENAILEYAETDYKILPIIFVDGNSVMLSKENGNSRQMTRPYVYHAESLQKLKNFAGNSLANELENIPQTKLAMCEEGIPEQYKSAYINPQRASVFVYRAFKDDNGQVPLPPPTPFQRVPVPPELAQTFMATDQMMQSVLGSYDAALGVNDNELSGRAIIESATQSNATAMPFIVNYMKALNRCAEVFIDLIPKYITKKRSLPTVDITGKKGYVVVNDANDSDSIMLDYKPNTFGIKIEAGVSFQIQQSRALQTMIQLMQVSKPFADFMMQEQGLEALLDNVDIRGIDGIKQGIGAYMQRQAQQQQMAQQMAMQQNPMVLKQMELQQKAQQHQVDAQLQAAQINVDKQRVDNEQMLTMAKIGEISDRGDIMRDKVQSENARTAVDAATKIAGLHHSHAMDILNLHHENERLAASDNMKINVRTPGTEAKKRGRSRKVEFS